MLGDIDPGELGVTLCHEHLSMNFGLHFTPSTKPEYRIYEDAPLSLDKLGWIRQNPYVIREQTFDMLGGDMFFSGSFFLAVHDIGEEKSQNMTIFKNGKYFSMWIKQK